jgi:2,3-bisphosphoglycerate-dependent phosphoglycerate mutase
MRFFFIRHAQSANNALWESTGANNGRSEDPELTEIGKQQVVLLARYLSEKDREVLQTGRQAQMKRDYFGFSHLYSSLMVRAVETGSAVADALRIPLVAWMEIHETGGIFLEDEITGEMRGLPGKPRSYFAEKYALLQMPENQWEDGWWNRDFESHEVRQERAKKVYQALLERHIGTNDHVAIVSHGGFYVHLMREIFGIQSDNFWFLMHNTGITRIDFDERDRPVLVYHNRTEHLPEDLLT